MMERKYWRKKAIAGTTAVCMMFSGAMTALAVEIQEITIEDVSQDTPIDVIEPDMGEDAVVDIDIMEEASDNFIVIGDDAEISIDKIVNLGDTVGEAESEADYETEREPGSESPVSQEQLRGELEALWEKLEQERDRTPVKDYLGLEELNEAIKENGLTFSLRAFLGDELAEALNIPESMKETSYYKTDLQIDPENRQWMFDTGVVLMGSDFLYLDLYGDRDMLAVSPMFYEKSLAIRSGNLYEQLKGSWAEETFHFIPEKTLKSIELDFFPDEETLQEWKEEIKKYYDFDEVNQKYEEILETFKEKVRIRKEVNDYDETVYYLEINWEDIKDFYIDGIVEVYMKPMVSANLISDNEYESYVSQMRETFEESNNALPEDPTVEIHVEDERINSISCEMFIDSSRMEDAGSDGITIVNGSETSKLDAGYIDFEVTFWEEMDGVLNTDVDIYARDIERNVQFAEYVSMMHSEDGTQAYDSVDISILEPTEEGELDVTYYCNLFTSMFDSETGEYRLVYSLTDQESDNTVSAEIESRFTDVVQGERFTWEISEVAVGQNDDTINALQGQITVIAQPTGITQPEDVDMILELPEEKVQQIIDVIDQNMKAFMGGSDTEESTENYGAAGVTERNTSKLP